MYIGNNASIAWTTQFHKKMLITKTVKYIVIIQLHLTNETHLTSTLLCILLHVSNWHMLTPNPKILLMNTIFIQLITPIL